MSTPKNTKAEAEHRISKRHVGLPVKFNAYDGKTYWGKLVSFRNRIAGIEYQVTNDHGCVTMDATGYIADLNRLEVA